MSGDPKNIRKSHKTNKIDNNQNCIKSERETREKLSKYESTIRQRIDCEEKAFQIVQKLIYSCVDAQYLIDCGKLITCDNYMDIVEERAISFLCGYPLCDKELANVPKKKYHISTQTNKVYEISERKNFCSYQCFKASKAFLKQIPESPLWMRDNEPNPAFTLLPHGSGKALIGTEVVGEQPWSYLKDEIENLSQLDSRTSSLAKRREELDCPKNFSKTKSKPTAADFVSPPLSNDKPNVLSNLEAISDEFTKLSFKETPLCHVENSSECVSTFQDSLSYSEKLKVPVLKDELKNKEHTSASNNVNEITSEKNKPTIGTNKNVSPLERLNLLLAKKKNMLSGMVDIQEIASEKNIHSEVLVSETDTTAITINAIIEPNAYGKFADSDKLSSSNQHLPSETKFEISNKIKSSVVKKQSLLQLICKRIQPWITEYTKQYVKPSVSAKTLDANKHTFSDPKMQNNYIDLCKRLDLQEQGINDGLELEDLTNPKTSVEPPKRQSVPDYMRLREESDQFQLQVTEFITGKRVKESTSSKADKAADDNNPVYLPTVDSYDQMAIRAKIVLGRLDKTVPEMLVPMKLTAEDVSSNLRELIYTFRLERDNITFRPSEWTLVAFVLLKMLSVKIKAIDSAFKRNTTLNYLNILLGAIGQTYQDLCVAVDDLLQ